MMKKHLEQHHSIVGKIVCVSFPSCTTRSAYQIKSFHRVGKLACSIFPSFTNTSLSRTTSLNSHIIPPRTSTYLENIIPSWGKDIVHVIFPSFTSANAYKITSFYRRVKLTCVLSFPLHQKTHLKQHHFNIS
jgi:hypothetical protein